MFIGPFLTNMDQSLSIFILVTCIKVLLIPAYRSTDFEVHRNWLAVTHSLPLLQWYVDATSEWTLDYPPLFAWFERVLAQTARLVDPAMLDVKNLNYCSWKTVFFQRSTVIVSDIVLYIGVLMCSNKAPGSAHGLGSGRVRLCLLVVASPALLLVDHVHFQYNGLLLGLLLISIGFSQQGHHLRSAFVFAVLLNMKHIFLYVAPAYFVFLLRVYCLHWPNGRCWPRIRFGNCVRLASLLALVFGVSLAPFIVANQLPQLLRRLFPFQRGLSHAYWAPNVWALYNFLDKILLVFARMTGMSLAASSDVASMTGGLVQDTAPALLPRISAGFTMIASLVAMLPGLVSVWRRPHNASALATGVTHCAAAAFLFGWHVHEKAILLVLTPLAVVALRSVDALSVHCQLSVVAACSVLPLLPTGAVVESTFKMTLTAALAVALPLLFPQRPLEGVSALVWRVYACVLASVCVYSEWVHVYCPWSERWPFLPLLLMSVTCALGVIASWLALLRSLAVTSHKVGGASLSAVAARNSRGTKTGYS